VRTDDALETYLSKNMEQTKKNLSRTDILRELLAVRKDTEQLQTQLRAAVVKSKGGIFSPTSETLLTEKILGKLKTLAESV
jgi:hypothetical protein